MDLTWIVTAKCWTSKQILEKLHLFKVDNLKHFYTRLSAPNIWTDVAHREVRQSPVPGSRKLFGLLGDSQDRDSADHHLALETPHPLFPIGGQQLLTHHVVASQLTHSPFTAPCSSTASGKETAAALPQSQAGSWAPGRALHRFWLAVFTGGPDWLIRREWQEHLP